MEIDKEKLEEALNPTLNKTQESPTTLANPNLVTPQSTNAAEKKKSGTPSNGNPYIAGNGLNSETAIVKSNKNLAHACDSESYVGKAIAQAGAFGGKIVKAIRDAIKALLEFFGVNPSSSGLVNQLKKYTQDIRAAVKWIKDVTDGITKFISYINAIKQLLAFILTLPAELLAYFKDCVATLKKQLVSSFQEALGTTSDPTDSQIKDLQDAIKDVQGSIQEFKQATAGLVTAVAGATISLLTPTQVSSGNTEQQAAATQSIFSAAGYTSTNGNFSKA